MTARWAETEELVEQWFRQNGWQYATRRGRAGHIDIENMPGLAPEVKSGQVWETRWLKQESNGPVPFILWRPPKFGPVSIGSWPTVFRLRDATTLLRDAGYGTDKEED